MDIDFDGSDRVCLYYKYPGQTGPQPAFIEINWDCENPSVVADYDPAIGGGVPADVYHGRRTRVPVDPCTDAAALARVLMGVDCQELLERMARGTSIDESRVNRPAVVTEDAQDAEVDLAAFLAQVTRVEIWDIADWLGESTILRLWDPGQQTLDQAVWELRQEIEGHDAHVIGDVREALVARIVQSGSRPESSLTHAHLEALVAVGEMTADEAWDVRRWM